jgi:hypothetical protein
MKADGIDYDERVELVEEVTWPQPLLPLLEATYEIYRRGHPWIAESPLSPKSVVRDMYERAMTFSEYVAFYGLTRSEGLVLRYLSDGYKALRSTVPEAARTEELVDLTEWLGEMVRQTDSSLLDEWEQLTDPDRGVEARREPAAAEPRPITSNERAFRVLVRNAMFRRVELAARRRTEELAGLDAGAGGARLDAEGWRVRLDAYFAEHDDVGTGADARGPAMLLVEQHPRHWVVQQILDDPSGDHDWRIWAEVDLVASDEAGELVLAVVDMAAL